MDYPYDDITINGRIVLIQDILDQNDIGQDEFEQHTFEFIRQWFSGVEDFTLQTSGSTGTPKKITFTRQQMIASATATQHALDLKSGFKALVCLDTQYVAGQMMLVRCFVTAMEIIAVTPAAHPLQNQPPVDFVALVPYQVYTILASDQKDAFNHRCIYIIGGAPLDAAAINKLQYFQASFYATYGMTETLSHIALKKLNGLDASVNFRIVPGISIQQDDRGCLVIDAPSLGTRVETNDIVEIFDQENFRWLGRYDNIINSGGVKIIPEIVEGMIATVFSGLHYPNRFFISSEADEKLGERVLLFVEGNLFSDDHQKIISEKLRKNLPTYAIPRAIVVVEKFETTQTGKINRLRTVQNSDKTLQKFTLKK